MEMTALLAALVLGASSLVYDDPAPGKGENGYRVSVDDVPATVSDVRCSAMPFNRRWPGHQRDISQTEICGMVRFGFADRAHVEVTAPRDFKTVRVRPYSRGVVPVRNGRTVALDIERPGWYSVEFDGYHRNLNLYADPPETRKVGATHPKVRRYGPGVHDVGIVNLTSGETVYLDSGAVVYGGFHASNATDIAILGRGIIDGSKLKEKILFQATGDGNMAVLNATREHTLHFINCRGVTVDGVVIRDSLCYNIGMWGCEDLCVTNVKIIGQWRYNTDGIDLHNCRRGRVTGCSVRSFDDSFCFKAHEGFGNCEDLTVEGCVAWTDWGKSLEVGVECRADHLRRLTYRDCDVIHAVKRTLNIHNVDYGRVSDVLFENIRIEGDEPMPLPQHQKDDASVFDPTLGLDRATMAFSAGVEFHPEYSVENGGTWGRGGFIDGVTLRNVSVTSATDRIRMAFNGLDAEHAPRNLVVENLVVNGRPIESADQVEMACDAFARPPRFLVDDIVRMNSTEMNRTAVSAEGGSGEVKVLVVGNSIVLHGISPKIGWTNEWGMAASAKEKDFAHLVVRGIERQTGRRASFRIRNAYELECDPAGYDFCTTYAKDIAWKPDYVVIALGENVKRIEDPSVAQAFRTALVKVGAAFKEANPEVKTVYRSVFWPNAAKTAQIRAAADATGSVFVDLGDMGDRAEFRADGLFVHKGVAKHPGDRGMAAMAEAVLKVLTR